MRFNQRELAFIAFQPAETFDLQGLLWLKEKDGYFWQRNETYTERWCRLRGNLLFYAKGSEKTSELAGLIVLERFFINRNLSSSKNHAFTLVFDEQDDNQQYHFAANSDAEFREWNRQIENASYERQKEKLHNLREQLMEMTGEDPLPPWHPLMQDQPKCVGLGNYSPSNSGENMDKPPLLEISIECNGLKTTTENRFPNSFVVVSTMTPPGSSWVRLGQTEIIEQKIDPFFLTAIVIPSGNKYSGVTRLKFAVFDVRDREKEEITHLGQTVCTARDVLTAPNKKIQLPLTGLDSPIPSGTITLLDWKIGSPSQEKRSINVDDDDEDCGSPRQRCGSVNRPKFHNVFQKAYIFPTILGTPLKVSEIMGESLLTFRIPQQLLKIYITEEKQKILDLNNLGELNEEWNRARKEILDNHFKLINDYTTLHRHLYQERERQDKGVSSGLNFKPSRLKTDQKLAFVTTNLHSQRLKLIDGSQEHVYDIVTFGAPSAHSMKFSKGGLRKLIGNLREAYYTQSGGDNRANRAKNKRVELDKVKKLLSEYCNELKKSLTSKSMEHISEIYQKLKDQTDHLLKYCDLTFIVESMSALKSSRPAETTSFPFEDDFQKDDLSTSSDSLTPGNLDIPVLRSTIDKLLEQISECLLQIDHEEKQVHEVPNKLVYLRDLIDDLVRATQCLIKEFDTGMVFVLFQEESRHAQTMQVLRQRRDICLSQAVCALIAGFEAKVYTSLNNKTFLKQLSQIGVLAEFESLLSTHGDEMAMLEDMSVAIRDLSTVRFKFAASEADKIPHVTGTRTNIQVTMFLNDENFFCLTKELQEGKFVRVYPVLFTQGINEHATLAERFGDTSLQETINNENFSLINFYYTKFLEYFTEEAEIVTPREPALGGLVEHLKANIATKKNKNVDILFLAQEICWRMNGIRFTSCKSAKDRTSMAVTLEQCSILKRKHNLQPDEFNHSLDAMRSQGTRRENCFKNAGIPQYAFNYWQVMALPRLYRPPDGTYGKNIQA